MQASRVMRVMRVMLAMLVILIMPAGRVRWSPRTA
jgi:hypothetical protein